MASESSSKRLRIEPAPTAESTLKRPRTALAPMLRPQAPSGSTAPHPGLQQSVMQVHDAASPKTLVRDDGFRAQVTHWAEQQRTASTKAEPTQPPELQIDLRRFSGTSKDVKADAVKQLGGPYSGGNQGGMFPSTSGHTHGHLPTHVDETYSRPRQMLSQLSDMMYHSAKHPGKADSHTAMEPVEIQFGYGIKDGRLDLFASGNTKESQQWLLQQRGKSPHEHVAKAALAEDADLAASATKLMFHTANRTRRAEQIDAAAPAEHRVALHQNLAIADQIHAKFMTGDYTVVTNTAPGKDPRHAEQNIGEVLHQEQYERGDMDGTKIRCGSCAASLGANLSSPDGKRYSGKFYTSQASPEHWQTLHGQIASGTHQVVTSLPSRPRANSYPSLPAVSLPVVTTSSGEGGTH